MFPIRLPYSDAALLLTPAGATWLPPLLQLPLLVLMCVVPLALMLWLYRYELKLIAAVPATLLLLLRLTVLLVLLLLACLQPVYARDVKRELPGRVLVLVDRSDSMDVVDPQRKPAEKLRLAKALRIAAGQVTDEQLDEWIANHEQKREPRWVKPDEARNDRARRREIEAERRKIHDQICARVDALTRTDITRHVLGPDGLRLLGTLTDKHEVELLGFHRDVWDVQPGKGGFSLEELFRAPEPGAAGQTSLRQPLVRALERSAPGRGKVLGIVLVTDGKHNFGLPPDAKAKELGERGVPIYPVGIGALTPPPNVAIASVRGPSNTVFKGVEVPVRVEYKISGRRAQRFVLELFRQDKDGKQVKAAERVIEHDGKERRETSAAQMTVRMDEPGTQPLTASLRPAGTEPQPAEIASVLAPGEGPFKGGNAEVTVRFKLRNQEAQEFVVSLHQRGKDGEKLLAQRVIRHDGRDRDYEEKLLAQLPGPRADELVATVRAGAPLRGTTVNVADDKADVLLVDGEARWEYHYIATALKRDPTMKLTTIVFDQPRLDEGLTPQQLEAMGSPRQQWPALPTTPDQPDPLNAFPCIILGDVDLNRLPLAERARLERYVADAGGTLVILAGKRHMPLEFLRTVGPNDPLRKLLPIESAHAYDPDDGFPLTVTQAGRDMRFLELDTEDREMNEALWAGRPRPWGWAVVGRAKPGAVPMAYIAKPGEEKVPLTERERRNAVIVRQNYGFGRVVFVGIDSTWRWRYLKGDLYHHRFWGHTIRWAASDKPLVTGNSFLRFGMPQPVYRQGDEIKVVARFNEALGQLPPNLLAGARIIRLPDRPDGAEKVEALVPLARHRAQPRVLEGQVSSLPPGRYAVELAIPAFADKLLGPAVEGQPRKPLRAEVTVLPPDSKEMVDLETDWDALKALATSSGGKVYTPENVGELVEKLAKESVPHVEHHEQRLYQWWVMLALVVALLTMEWAGRKWAGLP
jgi:hypothetical protein